MIEALAALPAVPFFWMAVTSSLSWMSGWGQLARLYPSPQPLPQGVTWRMGSGRMGPVRFNGMLIFTSNPEGLLMRVWLPFRFQHPPIYVPWSDIQMDRSDSFFYQDVVLHFRQAPDTSLRITRSLAEGLRRAAGHTPIRS